MAKTITHIITRITALPGQEDKLKALLLELIEPTRQEAGCIRYNLLQSCVTPTEFTLLEEWESKELFEAHLDSAHVQEAFLEGGQLLVAPPEIRHYHFLA
jgi:quinol monooxygenase YgiN